MPSRREAFGVIGGGNEGCRAVAERSAHLVSPRAEDDDGRWNPGGGDGVGDMGNQRLAAPFGDQLVFIAHPARPAGGEDERADRAGGCGGAGLRAFGLCQ
jgi:hypothetical protein